MAKSQIKTKALYKKLTKQLEESPEIPIEKHRGWVILSDLHMGDGGSTDDFKRNASLFQNATEKY